RRWIAYDVGRDVPDSQSHDLDEHRIRSLGDAIWRLCAVRRGMVDPEVRDADCTRVLPYGRSVVVRHSHTVRARNRLCQTEVIDGRALRVQRGLVAVVDLLIFVLPSASSVGE